MHLRTRTWTSLGLACALCSLLAFAASAGIVGGAHDFSGNGWSGGEICIPCHTPHDANQDVDYSPLWNHEVNIGTAYTLYSSPTLDEQPEQPRGPSLLCLSCHDGVTAIDSFGSRTGSTHMQGSALIGTDLSDDHPISLRWSHQTDLPSCGSCHRLHGPDPLVLPFYDGYLECSTCHDPHGDSGYTHLLREPLDGSQICLTCHGK